MDNQLLNIVTVSIVSSPGILLLVYAILNARKRKPIRITEIISKDALISLNKYNEFLKTSAVICDNAEKGDPVKGLKEEDFIITCSGTDNPHNKWDGIELIDPEQSLWMLKNQVEAELYKRNKK